VKWPLRVPNPAGPIGEPISSMIGSVVVSFGRMSYLSVAPGTLRVWVVDLVVVTIGGCNL
jgi:hypothetical protein